MIYNLAGDDEPAILPIAVLPHLLKREHLSSCHRNQLLFFPKIGRTTDEIEFSGLNLTESRN